MISQNLIIKICKLFYKEGLTKIEIEKRLNISRFKVARLLKQAQEKGIVKIEIMEPSPDLTEFEVRLEEATGLKNVILVLDNGESPELLKEKAGQAAAEYLMEVIGSNQVLGIGWGTTTYELVRSLPDSIDKTVTVVQVSGGNTALDTGVDSQALTVELAKKFGSSPLLMHAPAIVERLETKHALMQESSLKEIFRFYRKIQVLIGGIGALLPDRFLGSWINVPQEMHALRRQGAVSEFLSYCFALDGKHCPSKSQERSITIPLENIRRVPCSIGLAIGSEKADAVLGVLRSGYINTLITDTTTARAIWDKISHTEEKGAKP